MVKKYLLFVISALIIGGVCGAALILSTPLRYSELIEPIIHNIENTEFSALYEQNSEKYIFIDVRDPSTFAEGHPRGAINIPLARLYTEREKLPKTGKEIVLICGGNSASGVGFSYLQHYGFTNIKRIPGGYAEWLIAGLPIQTGTSTELE